MEHSITLPYWIFILMLVLSAWLLIDRVFFPGLRWYLRRRVNRVIEEVNTRLDIEIRPFQLTRKQALIDQLIFDDKVVAEIRDYAHEHQIPKEAAQAKAIKYASEIAPSFNAYMYFRFGYWMAKKIGRLIYRIRVGLYDDDQLRNITDNASIVFVMNHRSNMDYVLVSFLVAERTALSYAVGEWARIWPLQTLIKTMGAFFVRRNSRNSLYRRVLERYVNLATRAGVCQAVFPEGGLTRNGLMREPRLGFLDYMLRDFHPAIDRDIIFIPVGINYDRVIEDKSLVRRLDEAAVRRSRWFVIKTSIRFFFKTLLLERRARWRRFGYAGVNFGQPLSTKEFCQSCQLDFSQLGDQQRFDSVARLADQLMHRIRQVVPILPVPLMAKILLMKPDDWRSELELKTSAMQQIDRLKSSGAPINFPPGALEHVLNKALDMLVGRGMVDIEDGVFRPVESQRVLLEYYANSIDCWFDGLQ